MGTTRKLLFVLKLHLSKVTARHSLTWVFAMRKAEECTRTEKRSAFSIALWKQAYLILITICHFVNYLHVFSWRLCITTGKQQLGATGRLSTAMQSWFCPAGGSRAPRSWTQPSVSWSSQPQPDSSRYKWWQTWQTLLTCIFMALQNSLHSLLPCFTSEVVMFDLQPWCLCININLLIIYLKKL